LFSGGICTEIGTHSYCETSVSRNTNHGEQCNRHLQSLGPRRGGRKVALRLMSPPLLPLQPLPLHAYPPLPPLNLCWTMQLPTTVTGYTSRRSQNCTEAYDHSYHCHYTPTLPFYHSNHCHYMPPLPCYHSNDCHYTHPLPCHRSSYVGQCNCQLQSLGKRQRGRKIAMSILV
jgi:hypothetical protein